MAHARKKRSLLNDAASEPLLLRRLYLQELERHLPIEIRIPRPEGLAEPPLTDLLDQLEMGPRVRGRNASLLPADRRGAIEWARLERRFLGQRSGDVGQTCSRKILRLVKVRSSLGASLRTLRRLACGDLLFLCAPRRLRSPAANLDSDPVHFISMELVSGETLGQKIHEEKTDLRTLLGYLAQAAEGLAKAHAAGIVHRDLKPGNIMVSKDGFAKVLDFGLAKLTERHVSDEEATNAPTATEARTGQGTIIGTVGYMSPEQVQAKPVDHRSDIFSFG